MTVMMRLSVWVSVAYLLTASCLKTLTQAINCDKTEISTDDPSSKIGTITSPNFPAGYDQNMRCIYHLIGKSDERVKISFEEFEVKGVMPRCLNDYIDVYTQVRRRDANLLDVPIHGRYCGSDPERLPEQLISMTNIMVIGFYTDPAPEHEKEKGFNITYEFIKDYNYTIGTTASPGSCGQIIRSLLSGTLLSPTYPGMYPDNIKCFYKLHGAPGQRIKLTFKDIDLYSGGEHCPFDSVTIYDGEDNRAKVIETFCGSHKNISIFSTTENLHIDFETKSGRPEATKKAYILWDEEEVTEKRRGFEAHFDISSSFVSLDALVGEHVRGTECDQIILSSNETTGVVTSPYYPNFYPMNVTCLYYIDGLQDTQNLEKVKLAFEDLDIPKFGDGCEGNGYLRAFIKGQEPKANQIDREYCGRVAEPSNLTSTNPRLLLVFDTHGHTPGRGFKARYHFITDYAIPGTAVPSGPDGSCHFKYLSTSAKFGMFISPRHPSYYPHRTKCTYEFIGLEKEQVRITFENFKVENGNGNCTKDHVRVYNIEPYRYGLVGERETLVGHYCGDKLPGPQMSEAQSHKMKVEFTTNEEGAKAGFRAKYEFVDQKSILENITSGGGGVINSPNFPNKYLTNRTYEWYVYSRSRQGIILLIIDMFEMEGDPEKTGCGNTVLKIYTNNTGLPAYELCGNNQSYRHMSIVSQGNMLKLKFVSSAKAVGGKGFTLFWTDILNGGLKNSGKCSGFQCKISQYCIANELKCNKQPNCGHGDTSDETEGCGHARTQSGVLNVILGVVLSLILIIVAVVCVLHMRRKARHRKQQEKIEVHYITKSAGDVDRTAAGSSSDSVAANGGQNLFREHTEKVSIV